MKTSLKTILYCIVLLGGSVTLQTSCEFNNSTDIFEELDTQIEHQTIDEEDEKKQSPK